MSPLIVIVPPPDSDSEGEGLPVRAPAPPPPLLGVLLLPHPAAINPRARTNANRLSHFERMKLLLGISGDESRGTTDEPQVGLARTALSSRPTGAEGANR